MALRLDNVDVDEGVEGLAGESCPEPDLGINDMILANDRWATDVTGSVLVGVGVTGVWGVGVFGITGVDGRDKDTPLSTLFRRE